MKIDAPITAHDVTISADVSNHVIFDLKSTPLQYVAGILSFLAEVRPVVGLALGNVIAGILRPELQLIGESDARAGDVLTAIYARLNESTPTVVRKKSSCASGPRTTISSWTAGNFVFVTMAYLITASVQPISSAANL